MIWLRNAFVIWRSVSGQGRGGSVVGQSWTVEHCASYRRLFLQTSDQGVSVGGDELSADTKTGLRSLSTETDLKLAGSTDPRTCTEKPQTLEDYRRVHQVPRSVSSAPSSWPSVVAASSRRNIACSSISATSPRSVQDLPARWSYQSFSSSLRYVIW